MGQRLKRKRKVAKLQMRKSRAAGKNTRDEYLALKAKRSQDPNPPISYLGTAAWSAKRSQDPDPPASAVNTCEDLSQKFVQDIHLFGDLDEYRSAGYFVMKIGNPKTLHFKLALLLNSKPAHSRKSPIPAQVKNMIQEKFPEEDTYVVGLESFDVDSHNGGTTTIFIPPEIFVPQTLKFYQEVAEPLMQSPFLTGLI